VSSPGNGVTGQIPPAYRRVGVPAGSDVRIRAKASGTPASLVVEDASGNDILKISVNADGALDMKYDPARITEAARRLLAEARWLLQRDTGSTQPHIRVRAGDTGEPPEAGATDP